MDQHYNNDKAKELLQLYAEGRKDIPEAGPRLGELAEISTWPPSVKAMETGVPMAWRLVLEEEAGDLEEIVFHIQGIVTAKDLPPMYIKPSRNAKIGHLRQAITITGMGTKLFEDAVCGVGVVDSQFRRHVDDRRMEDTNVVVRYKGWSALDLSNRYFTAKGAANGEEEVPFTPSVDPKGVLQSLTGSGHVHLAENVVEYLQMKVNQQGDHWFEDISPSSIRVGDIVEAQASLLAVQTGKERFRTVAVLRCITLLDTSVTEEADKTKRKGSMIGKLKRKTGHTSEMAAAAREREKRARIQNANAEGEGRKRTPGDLEGEDKDQRASTHRGNETTGADIEMRKTGENSPEERQESEVMTIEM